MNQARDIFEIREDSVGRPRPEEPIVIFDGIKGLLGQPGIDRNIPRRTEVLAKIEESAAKIMRCLAIDRNDERANLEGMTEEFLSLPHELRNTLLSFLLELIMDNRLDYLAHPGNRRKFLSFLGTIDVESQTSHLEDKKQIGVLHLKRKRSLDEVHETMRTLLVMIQEEVQKVVPNLNPSSEAQSAMQKLQPFFDNLDFEQLELFERLGNRVAQIRLNQDPYQSDVSIEGLKSNGHFMLIKGTAEVAQILRTTSGFGLEKLLELFREYRRVRGKVRSLGDRRRGPQRRRKNAPVFELFDKRSADRRRA